MWSPTRKDRVVDQIARERALSAPIDDKKGHHHYQQRQQQNSKLNSSAATGGRGSTEVKLPSISNNNNSNKINKQKREQAEKGNSARYLALKVESQRKERQQREVEQQELQTRVNEHLTSLLVTHRQQKKEMMTRWSSYASNPIPKSPPLNSIARARLEDEQRFERERKERKILAKEVTKNRLQQHAITPASKLGDSGNNPYVLVSANEMAKQKASSSSSQQQQQDQSDYYQTQHHGGETTTSAAAEADAKASANFAQIAKIYETVLQPTYSGNVERGTVDDPNKIEIGGDFVPSSIRDMCDGHCDNEEKSFGPLLVGFSPEQKQRLLIVEQKHEKTMNRLHAKHAMYQRAKQRREVAFQRIKDDPPADVLVQADLRRYIPADLLETLPDLNVGGEDDDSLLKNNIRSPTAAGKKNVISTATTTTTNVGTSSSVFLTDVDAENKKTNTQQQQQQQKKNEDVEEQGTNDVELNDIDDEEENNNKKKTTKKKKKKNDMMMDGSFKAKAMLGGPLENADNNRRMSIFARETLLKLEHSKQQQQQEKQMKNSSSSLSSNSFEGDNDVQDASTMMMYPEALDTAQEERAAVEWYRRYHDPIIKGGNTRGVGRRGMYKIKDEWNVMHPPTETLPQPSRTLFFDQERPKDALRKNLF